MSLLGHFVPHTKSEDLHVQIYKHHLVYLNQEDSPAKIAKWNSLEGLVAEYLALVPHKKKFACPEVAATLHRSVSELPSFNALKAASVFQTLEKYATNLLSYPWRKEHASIKLYSGYYKHSVESHLLGAEAIMFLMGYREGHKELVLELEEPVDPDSVAKVALDCLVAYVECQIMIQIWEKMQPLQVSWADIHKIRQDYVCTIEEAVRLLQQIKRANGEKSKPCRDNYIWSNEPVDHESSKPENLPPKTRTDLLLDMTGGSSKHRLVDPPLGGGRLQFDGLTITRSKSPSWTEGLSASRDRISAIRNNFCSWENDSDLFPPQDGYWDTNAPSYEYPYNTTSMSSNESWDLLNTPIRNSHGSYSNTQPPNFYHKHPLYSGHFRPNQCAPSPGPPHFNENCACRFYQYPPQTTASSYGSQVPYADDFMPNSSNYKHARASMELDNLIDSFQHLHKPVNIKEEPKAPPNLIAPKPKKITNNESNSLLLSHDSPPATRKRGSIYDNVATDVENERTSTEPPQPQKKEQEAVKLPKKLAPKSIDCVDASPKPPKTKLEIVGGSCLPAIETKIYDEKVLKPAELLAVKTNGISVRWSCTFCTFINEPKNDVCEMCSRSRHPGSESTPLVSGGRECPHCTLVNDKSATCCIACEASLKDSPTYI